MLTRSGSFTKPSPLVEFDCGSQSTSSVLTSAAASEAARLMAVVVLPTPPFWLATAMIRPMIFFLVLRPEYSNGSAKSIQIAVQNPRVFHVKHCRGSYLFCDVFHVKHSVNTPCQGGAFPAWDTLSGCLTMRQNQFSHHLVPAIA